MVSVVAMLVASLPSWNGDDLQNIEVARIATVVEDAGLAVCPVGNSMEPLLAYRQTQEPILGAGQFERCDLVYGLDELGDWAVDAFELAAGGVVLRTDSGTSDFTLLWTAEAVAEVPELSVVAESGETPARWEDS